ncbi:MAG: hypothetical protein OEN01_14850 [Candidatus Krumholzibacteria bacterium]|nr:hypothetical protein [Candidatus Krumholzibacteria bacterium]
MKKIFVFVLLIVVGLGCRQGLQSESLNPEALRDLDKWFEYFVVLEPTENDPMRYIYADTGPHIHVYDVKDGRADLAWESTNLGSPITALLVRDVNRDGKPSIMVTTRNGRIIAFDLDTYEREWENFEEPFESIECLTAANIDRDPQDEVMFIATRLGGGGSLLYIYDAVTRALEWRSQENFVATEILVGNVDDDPQPEIILNSGFVIDSRFYIIDLVKTEGGGFGNRIVLQDLNNDGYPEVIGQLPNRSLKVYDIYAEREIW